MRSDLEDTYLRRRLHGLADQHPGESGFYPLTLGVDALAARLVLAEKAEQSIDAQYYQVTNDLVSQGFFDVLLRAADRGVHVRLLIDDVFTRGYDAGLAGMDSHPNFSIRVFNPFRRRKARIIDGLTSFSRVNRRMHNKSFTVDRVITLIGGRNIADEYYGAGENVNFGDLDVVGIGALVDDVTDMFESFWNHESAATLRDFAKMPDDAGAELARIRVMLEASRSDVGKSPYATAVRSRFFEYMEADKSPFTWAPYTLLADTPGKSRKSEAAQAASIKNPLRESLLAARNELLIISPYFVPRKSGIRAFAELQKRGVDVTIVTNSLAANNQPAVHAGYAPCRKPLLKSGVKIYEVRADADVPGAEIVAVDDAKATLHTKAFIVDRSEWFIGSFNFDPRSADINTEMGVIIRSSELAERAAASFRAALPSTTFEVVLNDRGRLAWRGIEGDHQVELDKEPQTSWLQRVATRLMRILPIRGQL